MPRHLSPFRTRWSVGLWLLAGLLAGWLALDAGATCDEPIQKEYGDLILAWFRSGFQDAAALSYGNLYFYGGLFDLPAQWLWSTGISPWGEYETRHVLTALVALLGVAGTYLTAARIGGRFAGVCGALLLMLTPTWVGHGWFNPKDVPFGAAVSFVAYASVRIALRPAPLLLRDALIAGIAVGCALGVRSGGMFLLMFPVLAAFGRAALTSFALRRRGLGGGEERLVAAIVTRLACALPIAWLLMIATWPWAQLAPLTRPLIAASEAAHFPWIGPTLFQGKTIFTDALPLSYLPVWFSVTVPELHMLALGAGLLSLGWVRSWRLDRAWALAVLAALIVVPVVGVLVAHPTLYDAHRHFLFVWPPLAALAGVSLAHVLTRAPLPRWAAGGLAAGALALAALVLVDMVQLHPYEYVYFNRVSGGLRRQVKRFETDYWAATHRAGIEWLVKHVRKDGRRRLRVAGCRGYDGSLDYHLHQHPGASRHFVMTHDPEDADILFATTRYNCHHARGRLIHTVKRQGVRLLYVFRR
ncbi:MAG: hypothetical protein ABW321_04210 [Polyangiales bacterium]